MEKSVKTSAFLRHGVGLLCFSSEIPTSLFFQTGDSSAPFLQHALLFPFPAVPGGQQAEALPGKTGLNHRFFVKM